ncbi:hypothetical protein KC19_N009200, partial [Ceratodon purpureus]
LCTRGPYRHCSIFAVESKCPSPGQVPSLGNHLQAQVILRSRTATGPSPESITCSLEGRTDIHSDRTVMRFPSNVSPNARDVA